MESHLGTVTSLSCVVLMTLPTFLLIFWCVGLLALKTAEWAMERALMRFHRDDGLQTSRL